MNEIVPGIYHWTATHPSIRATVSSYYVEPAGIVVDPLEPEDGMGFFDALDAPPQQVVLTNCLHWRHSDRFRDRYGIPIRAVAAGFYRFEGTDREAEPFEFGEEVAPGVTAIEVGGICPDDAALYIEHGPGAVAFADAVVSAHGAPAFVPDELWGDPRPEQEAVRQSLRGLLGLDFDALLFAHGEPIASGGHSALSDFASKPAGQPDLGHSA